MVTFYNTLQNEMCVAFGPGKDMFDSTKIIAENQYKKALVSWLTTFSLVHLKLKRRNLLHIIYNFVNYCNTVCLIVQYKFTSHRIM